MELAKCQHCLEFEEELQGLRRRLAASGKYVEYSPGPNPNPTVDGELVRWMGINPGADAAAGYRAGWTRLARALDARLRDWEGRFLRARRDNAGLRAHIDALVAEIKRLEGR